MEPIACPSGTEIGSAVDVLHRYRLHFYQLLYFHKPPLTDPGQHGLFTVTNDPVHAACVSITCNRDRSYSFNVHYARDNDAAVLWKCLQISTAIKENRQKFDSRVCCALALPSPCVCALSYVCPIHGSGHHGTHD